MAPPAFTNDELAAFEEILEATPEWQTWQRRSGAGGEDVLEVSAGNRTGRPVRIAKTAPSRFVATGVDGWNLTVSDDLETLLEAITPRNGGPNSQQLQPTPRSRGTRSSARLFS